MFDPVDKCGVLSDYDLTNMAWVQRVPGTDRTGTIPFMALDLLTNDYWDGRLQRYYHHELESFFWTLIVVFLACNPGSLELYNEFIKNWFIPDHVVCWKDKTHFLFKRLKDAFESVQGNFEESVFLMDDMCWLIADQNNQRDQQRDQQRRKERRKLHSQPGAKAHGGDVSHINHSESMWDGFIDVLSQSGITVDISKLQTHKPTFDTAQCQELFKEMQEIHQSVIWNIT